MKNYTQSYTIQTMILFAALMCASIVVGAEVDATRQIVLDSGIKGGLIVDLRTANVRETAALRLNDRFLVQGLTSDAARVSEARKALRQMGLLGPVTVVHWRGTNLPYADNMVNLVVASDECQVTSEEIMRVLAPGGVFLALGSRLSTLDSLRKPWPEDIDEWTHFLHGPDNNAVAEDTRVAPPHHMQWVAGPRWGRSHDHLASMSAAVSASGRIFYIVDEGPIASVNEPSQWMLVARDAFNGVLLWKKKIGPWETQLRPFRSGPSELPRRLVAVGDRVYATLGYGKPTVALNAATGDELRTYEGTDNTHEILYHDAKLHLVISDPLSDELAEESKTTGKLVRRLALWRGFYGRYVTKYLSKQIQCLEADTGKLLWKKKDADTKDVMALTLAVAEGRVFFENEKEILALEADSGKIAWRASRPIALRRYAWSSPTLVVADGVVLSADRAADANLDTEGGDESELEFLVTSNHLLTGGEMMAFSAETGEKLWTVPCHEGFNFPVDVFVAQGKVWSGELAWGRQPGLTKVYDLHTGEVVAERPPDQQVYTIGFGHARCYRNKATTQYVIHGRSGVEFLDMSSSQIIADHWIRGTCQYGILPCNGLLYVPPHSCACYIEAKLNSFNVLAAARESRSQEAEESEGKGRLERGPAYGVSDLQPSASSLQPSSWPTYRHDGGRSGAAATTLSPKLKLGWEKTIPGPLTSVVVADGRLFVAQKDRHTVHALDTADGSPLWQYTVGGRVDSPPTICTFVVPPSGGLDETDDGNSTQEPPEGGTTNSFCLFGSADGWVYCLRATDGELAWRFRLAPEARQIVSYGQLESVWPIHGNVLVHEGQAPSSSPSVYAVAGRNAFTDGGLFLYRLDARSGELISERRISHRDPETGREPQSTVRGVAMPGALPDVLSTDGSSIFMRHVRFDMQGNPVPQDADHLFSPAGFLDDAWWHRTYWQIGTTMAGGYGGWAQVGNRRISGRLLVLGKDRVFGYGRKQYGITGAHPGLNAEHQLFAAGAELVRPEPPKTPKAKRSRRPATKVEYHWSEALPFYVRGMLLAGDTLFVAGPNDVAELVEEKPDGNVWLWAVSAADGTKKAEYRLKASPVFDSLAAANDCLFFTTVDDRVVCYQAQD